MSDHLNYNRQSVALALYRLSDAARQGAEVFSDPAGACGEADALDALKSRQQSVDHALLIVEATRHGIRKAHDRRGVA